MPFCKMYRRTLIIELRRTQSRPIEIRCEQIGLEWSGISKNSLNKNSGANVWNGFIWLRNVPMAVLVNTAITAHFVPNEAEHFLTMWDTTSLRGVCSMEFVSAMSSVKTIVSCKHIKLGHDISFPHYILLLYTKAPTIDAMYVW
jgi:hypothetical protein